jgi:hypothetical protein
LLSEAVLRPRRPERIFCTLHEAAVFLGLPDSALKQCHKRGTLRGVARAIDGSLWTPGGRSKLLLEVSAVREELDHERRRGPEPHADPLGLVGFVWP